MLLPHRPKPLYLLLNLSDHSSDFLSIEAPECIYPGPPTEEFFQMASTPQSYPDHLQALLLNEFQISPATQPCFVLRQIR